MVERTLPGTRAPVDDPVAARIRSLRLALGWSLKKLSESSGGLAPSFLFNIENGRKVPSEEVAVRICTALGDSEHEATYRAWARVKSRGRNGRADHEAMLAAWEQLRRGFDASGVSQEIDASSGARDAGRLRVPVLAAAIDPGEGMRPPAECVVNTLSLDPSIYGHDAERARERFVRLRRPFAFPLDSVQAARVKGLPSGYLAVVTRDRDDEAAKHEHGPLAFVLRCLGRLEVVSGDALGGGPIPLPLRDAGLDTHEALRAALLGRIDLLLPDVRL
ncbi:MAG: helix-turn-helix transcriptional regulator [Candidatus Eisenbacteria bacterium]